MPPHCDSIDGPVVKAAMKALDTREVRIILPFVPEEGEAEVTEAFEKVIKVRAHSPEAKDAADRHFFETVVRIHRAGEGEDVFQRAMDDGVDFKLHSAILSHSPSGRPT